MADARFGKWRKCTSYEILTLRDGTRGELVEVESCASGPVIRQCAFVPDDAERDIMFGVRFNERDVFDARGKLIA